MDTILISLKQKRWVNSVVKLNVLSLIGYDMPIFYDNWGLIKEHKGTRDYAGIFDVSHMGQIKIYGSDRKDFVNRIWVSDLEKLSPTKAC